MKRRIILEAERNFRSAMDAGILEQGSWGDGLSTVCAMSAMVPGATTTTECVTAGWPEWLVRMVTKLYDWRVEVYDEQAAADQWALRVAIAVSSAGLDVARARDLFCYHVLSHVCWISVEAVQPVMDVLTTRLAGQRDDPVLKEWADRAEAIASKVDGHSSSMQAAREAATSASFVAVSGRYGNTALDRLNVEWAVEAAQTAIRLSGVRMHRGKVKAMMRETLVTALRGANLIFRVAGESS